MRLPGRLAAAIDVLTAIEARHRPASEALRDWGNGNRFAGAGDRAAIGNLVYDALRRRASHAWSMGTDTPRALTLSVAVRDWGEDPDALSASFAGDRFAPVPITDDERTRLLASDPLAGAPDWVRADVPEWTMPSLRQSFGDDWLAECRAMTERPPLDLRVNTLRSTRERVEKSLARFAPTRDGPAPDGLRLSAGARDSRTPNIVTDEGYLKGWFEVQDQGSQLAALLTSAHGGDQVLDLCAGAGGKTLAMAAAMNNSGQIFAYDRDRTRLAPIYDRLKRATVRNVQVRAPEPGALDDLAGKMDLVVIDAPCSGSGTWRRRPDTKWRLTPEQVALRVGEQSAVLSDALRYVKPGGRVAYITCSVLADENDAQAKVLLANNPTLTPVDLSEQFGSLMPNAGFRTTAIGSVALTPHITKTDGFYVFVCSQSAVA